MRLRLSLAVLSTLALVPVGVAAAPAASAAPTCAPSVTALPLLPGATGGAVKAAVSDVAAGTVATPDGTRAVLWLHRHGRWTVSPIPGVAALPKAGWYMDVTGVNRRGDVSLTFYDSYFSSRAYVAARGRIFPLMDGAHQFNASATGIGQSGRVVGSAYSEQEHQSYPVRWDYWDQVPRSLGWGNPFYPTTATAIDDNDDIAGWSYWGPHHGGSAVRLDGDGTFQGLDAGPQVGGATPLATPTDLNSAEMTVGHGADGAYVWDHGVRTVLPTFPGFGKTTIEMPESVSERGLVAGYENDKRRTGAPTVAHVLVWTVTSGLQSLLPLTGHWNDSAWATEATDDGAVFGGSVQTSGGPLVPTVWTCALQQAFTPTASGVPAGYRGPEVTL